MGVESTLVYTTGGVQAFMTHYNMCSVLFCSVLLFIYYYYSDSKEPRSKETTTLGSCIQKGLGSMGTRAMA